MMITVQLEPDGPITEMDELLLIRRVGAHDDENERADWVEYRLRSDPNNPRAVHRSVHVTLKKVPTLCNSAVGGFA